MSVQNKPLPFLNQQKFRITKSASGRTRNLNTIMRIGRKAAEGRRSPRRKAFACGLRMREASWSAPALWRFQGGDKDFIVAISKLRFTPSGNVNYACYFTPTQSSPAACS
jgi:hypothetical protein